MAVTQERVARGGVRTVYAITPKGRAEFQTLLHRQWAEEGPVAQTLYGALLFLHLADLRKVKTILRARIARLDGLIAKLGPIRKQLAPVMATGGIYLLNHIDRQRRLDRQWLKDLLSEIEAGRVRDIADPKILAAPESQKALKRNAKPAATAKRAKT